MLLPSGEHGTGRQYLATIRFNLHLNLEHWKTGEMTDALSDFNYIGVVQSVTGERDLRYRQI
jgi:hypothetical protein